MSKVALVTDSTAYLPQDLVERYGITVAPQMLNWGNETFRDGIDILPDEFYKRLQSAKTLPTTSQVTPGAFNEIFCRLLEQDYHVLAILISEHLSGTYSSAIQAQAMLPGAPVEIVNSHTTVMAMGFQVLAAARAAADGATLAECKELAEQARANTGIVFAVDTLEFLHRGGRISGGSRLLGTALNIKPILEVSGGRVEPVEKVRTRKKSFNRLLELVEERVGGRRPVRLATVHANAIGDAREIMANANGQFDAIERIVSDLSPVVGTHTGPGTVGLAYMAGM